MDVCRICLVEEADVFLSLFSKLEIIPIADMVNDLTGLKISKGDGLPRFVCKECSEDVLKSFKIRLKCLESDAQLRILLEKNRRKLEAVESYLKREAQKVACRDATGNDITNVPSGVIRDVVENADLISFFESQKPTINTVMNDDQLADEADILIAGSTDLEMDTTIKQEINSSAYNVENEVNNSDSAKSVDNILPKKNMDMLSTWM
ncbi:uncharacterized protein LOC129727684 isoform X2 [Wyeomyia smithii]|uniref:uncharacterized protein LOC129727684 isoform X2 n=1 Tax=Wyeomyia smithii TaxID=174621 RepID=UPI002468227B|nr:uncharacterized protein LOC129727684 isoform X2 [Wyeomyia smithii]